MINENIKNIKLTDFHYDLPHSKIAQFPLEERDKAKLLIYSKGQLIDEHFYNIGDYLPKDSYLIFNDTKVIHARLLFKKVNGATIEIFLLNPDDPKDISLALTKTDNCQWKCLIGNKKRWKGGGILTQQIKIGEDTVEISAKLTNREENIVEFSLSSSVYTFGEVIHELGKMPLPPYIRRDPTQGDDSHYQTIYSKVSGAVACPTAGLHFTDNVVKNLDSKGFGHDFVTLHVSAGTFQPVKDEAIWQHNMHSEQIIISKSTLKNMYAHLDTIVAVGTTSLRVLESIYWYGLKLMNHKEFHNDCLVEKLDPYSIYENTPSVKTVLEAIINNMTLNNIPYICGSTEILILPSYDFKVCKALITNFHMPNTTLMFLIAAFMGEDWRKMYSLALEKDYRFLSYGDATLLLP
jgi:S-adenosylmethionine:tRNA ribosyltransferase-isomerase